MRVQRLSGGGRFRSAAEAVASFGAVQAQEFAEVKWSLAERMDGEPTDAELDAAFDRGEMIRTHILRPTWHFVTPEDLGWMLELSAPRVHQANKGPYRQMGLEQNLLERSADAIARALSDGEPKLRKELAVALAEAGINVEGMALGYVVHFAELEGVVCSGPRRGKQQTYMLVADRVPKTAERSREDALAELARRYFGGHGPGTLRDFSWWSGLTQSDCREAVEQAGDDVAPLDLGDERDWFGAPRPSRVPKRTGTHLIPMYDELGVAFRDLRIVCAAPPPEGMMARPILIDGVAVGSWKRTFANRRVVVEATLLRKLGSTEGDELAETVARFGRFLELDAQLETRLVSG